jgi:CO/xanthine dehydrogenase FAD-binding subunit
MDFLQPTSWADALAVRAQRPDAVAIAGGTDVMVDLNFDRRRPGALLDLGRVPELREWATEDGWVRLGAGVPYARIIDDLGNRVSGLAMAARTVGSPQIRIRGTVGGNLGSASPAGDAHPPLLAAGAVVEVASAARGVRRIPAAEFYTGVKRNALAADELIAAVLVPTATGPQQFCKVGTRNAMVIAVSAFACALHPDRRAVGTGIGSAAPTPAGRPRPRSSSPANSTPPASGTPVVSCRTRSPVLSASGSPPRRPPSTTSGGARPTAGTRWR